MRQTHNLLTWSGVLKALSRGNAQITDYGDPIGPVLFDPSLHAGNSQRIEARLFVFLCEQGWIETADEGRIRRFVISDAGIARLNTISHSAD